MTLYFRIGEPLNHIHQDTKSARLIAVCKRTLGPQKAYYRTFTVLYLEYFFKVVVFSLDLHKKDEMFCREVLDE